MKLVPLGDRVVLKQLAAESKTKSGWQFTWTDGLNRFYTEHYDGCSKVEARKQFINLVYSKTV